MKLTSRPYYQTDRKYRPVCRGWKRWEVHVKFDSSKKKTRMNLTEKDYEVSQLTELVRGRIWKQVFVKRGMNLRVQWQRVISHNYGLLKRCSATYRLITLSEKENHVACAWPTFADPSLLAHGEIIYPGDRQETCFIQEVTAGQCHALDMHSLTWVLNREAREIHLPSIHEGKSWGKVGLEFRSRSKNFCTLPCVRTGSKTQEFLYPIFTGRLIWCVLLEEDITKVYNCSSPHWLYKKLF
jgi:peptide methionine sulfoxide reductase MsrB